MPWEPGKDAWPARLDSETLDLVVSTLREYAARELKPEVLLELDRKDEFPMHVLRDLYDPTQIGLHLLFLPEDCGGLGGGAHDIYRVSSVMAEIDLGVATGVLATFLGTDPITVGGTPEQKRTWMGRIANEGLLVVYGATEPQAGSDLAALTTVAVPITEDGRVTAYAGVAPDLDAEALRAVTHWRYTPTLLDGVPVPVHMTVTVNFKLR